MQIEDIERSGEQRLRALLAAIDTIDKDRQIPLLRAAINNALEQVAAGEERYYDFLGECALLASQNMQDVRLHDVERRLARLEKPDAPSAYAVAFEVGVILAVELVVTLGAPWLAGPVLTFIAARSLARSSRVTARGTRRLTAAREFRSTRLDSLETDLLQARDRLAELKRRLKDFHPDYPPHGLREEVGAAAEAVRSAETARDLAAMSLADLQAGARVEKLVDAYQAALGGRLARLQSKQLSDFLNGAVGHTIKGRIGESGGQELARLLTTDPTGAGSGTLAESPFLSSTVVGGVLSELRERQIEAASGHHLTRLVLDRIPDEQFATDAVVHDIARGIFDALGPLDEAFVLADLIRPVLVRGIEAQLWYEWLWVTGALQVEPGDEFVAHIRMEPGEVYEGRVVSKLVAQPHMEPGGMPSTLLNLLAFVIAEYRYEGARYAPLSEPVASYLYDTFAAAYFAVPENARRLPFKDPYDPDRYTEVLSRASTTTGQVLNNFERGRRLDEMRIMVVIFFQEFVPESRGKVGYGALTDEVVLGDDYLAMLPAPEAASAGATSEQDRAEPTPEEVAARLAALLGSSGSVSQSQLSAALTQFDNQVSQLRHGLWIHELGPSQLSHEAAEGPDGLTVEEAAALIREMKQQVGTYYQSLLELLAQFDPQAASDFKRRYSTLVRRLLASPIGEPQPAKRRFP